VIDSLEVLAPDPAPVAIELIEHALARLDQADLDDSDGWMVQFCQRLTVLHTEATAAAGLPNDEVAARRTRIQALDLRPFDGLVDLD
jgi:hypothetical protein